jgi:hypothetical protein
MLQIQVYFSATLVTVKWPQSSIISITQGYGKLALPRLFVILSTVTNGYVASFTSYIARTDTDNKLFDIF